MTLTKEWLVKNVGPPSNPWHGRSKYSDICKLAEKFQHSPRLTERFELGLELWRKLDEWSYSRHSGATTPAQRQEKDRQQKWLNVYERELKDYLFTLFPDAKLQTRMKSFSVRDPKHKEKDGVTVLLHEMKSSHIPLLKNTGIHLAADVANMIFEHIARGGYSGSKLSMNPGVLHNKNQGMGTLVHECHHKLNVQPARVDGKEFKYIDEFVAHWKEHEITRPNDGPSSRAIWVHEKLKLYSGAIEAWEKKYARLGNISQTGPYAVPNNAQRRSASPDFNQLPEVVLRV